MSNHDSKSNEQSKNSTEETSNNSSSTTNYHTLQRTWPSQANTSGQAQPRPSDLASMTEKYSLERWAGESMKEQPWNGIGEFAERREADRDHAGGEEGSNGGEVDSRANHDA